jgi:quercetin dioxygenase-like cupin family protein
VIEKTYSFARSESKVIERIVEDENAAINHMVLCRYDALPEHNANSNVYMIIVRGSMALRLDDQATQEYAAGTIINIPYRTKMLVANENSDILEFFVVKSPSPGHLHP